jgi:predicted RNA-binding Zn-ribbon protein involved in translation (DUF1610 family)
MLATMATVCPGCQVDVVLLSEGDDSALFECPSCGELTAIDHVNRTVVRLGFAAASGAYITRCSCRIRSFFAREALLIACPRCGNWSGWTLQRHGSGAVPVHGSEAASAKESRAAKRNRSA